MVLYYSQKILKFIEMKTFVFSIVAVVIIGCFEPKIKTGNSKIINDTIVLNNFQIDIKSNEKNSTDTNKSNHIIELLYLNKSNGNLLIGNPDCPIYLSVKLVLQNTAINPVEEVRPSPCNKDQITIPPNSTYIYKLNLTNIFSLVPNQMYDIEVYYYGPISNDKSVLKTNMKAVKATGKVKT